MVRREPKELYSFESWNHCFPLSCEHHEESKCLSPAERLEPGTRGSGIKYFPITSSLYLGWVAYSLSALTSTSIKMVFEAMNVNTHQTLKHGVTVKPSNWCELQPGLKTAPA